MILQLTKLWLVNTVTLEMIGAQSQDGRARSASVDGAVRKYAGGRMRAIGTIGKYGSWKFSLVELTLAQCTTLENWMAYGYTIFARDHRGQSMYGTFFSVDFDENKSQLYANATYVAAIELSRVDVVEGV